VLNVSKAANSAFGHASRRDFLKYAGGGIAAATIGGAVQSVVQAAPATAAAPPEGLQSQSGKLDVKLPEIHGKADPQSKEMKVEPPSTRVGFAIVGLGHLTLEEILPAFGRSKYAKPVALVSGDRAKALKVARQYGIAESAIYDYQNYDDIRLNPEIEVVFIVLPNSLHREFTVRGAKAGKHILCEKPMATSSKDCRAMIAACKQADRKLMIAYRQQYEPMNRHIVKQVRENKLGKLHHFSASNIQSTGDPAQWRLDKELSGGGALPDIGIYCLNAARFLSGEEPSEVLATTYSTPGDARFVEVEESVDFIVKFPSGFTASCTSGYSSHSSKFLRLTGSEGWARIDPGFGYHGSRLSYGMLQDGRNAVVEPGVEDADQFALEIDHMAHCVRNDIQPHTPGEEGLQDQLVMEAIYESASKGKAVRIAQPAGPTRGPEPDNPG